MSARRVARLSSSAFVVGSLTLALIVAVLISGFASPSPDGLEHVARTVGFEHTAQAHPLGGGPFADYTVAALQSPAQSQVLVGVAGCAATFIAAWLLSLVVRRRR